MRRGGDGGDDNGRKIGEVGDLSKLINQLKQNIMNTGNQNPSSETPSSQGGVSGCIISSELIAFRTVNFGIDQNDIWYERVFLFKNEEEVKSFFTDENLHLKRIFADKGKIKNLKIYTPDRNPEFITGISFYTKHAHEVVFSRMNCGYVVDFNSR